MKYIVLVLCLSLFACDEEKVVCKTSLNCEDDVEMVCDEPSVSESDDGSTVSVTACTYITYEHCFEKTVCSKAED